jgi:hypothetical protein
MDAKEVFNEFMKITKAGDSIFERRSVQVAVLLILTVFLSAGSGLYAGASFFPEQAPSVTVTTTIFTTTTSWTTSTIWSIVTQTVQGVLTTVQYTTSTSTVTMTAGATTTYTAYAGGSGSSGQAGSGYVVAFPVTLPSSGAVSSIGVNWAGTQSGSVRVALYSAGSGKPGSLLAESASTAMTTAAGWQDVPVTSYSAAAGTYWIAIQLSSAKSVYYQSGSRSWYVKSFGAFDSSWSGSSRQDSAAQWNMRVTYVGALYDANTNVPSASFYGLPTGDFHLAVHGDALGPSGKFLEWSQQQLA